MMLREEYKKYPIVVDLDGTLILDEISILAFKKLIASKPLKLFMTPFWMLKGMGYFKRRVAQLVQINPALLNYNPKVLQFIKSHKSQQIILATGADEKFAKAVSRFLKLFRHVIASDGRVNCVSHEKASRLNERFGKGAYVYLGNSSQDIAVWQDCVFAIAVNTPKNVLKDLKKLNVPFAVL